jgi:hypothetical protein
VGRSRRAVEKGAWVVWTRRQDVQRERGAEDGRSDGDCVRAERCRHVLYARGAVDVAERERSLERGQEKRWMGYGSTSREGEASNSGIVMRSKQTLT